MKQLRLLQVQPATDYYAWQTEVSIKRSLELGYNGNFIDVVAGFRDGFIPDSWIKLQQNLPFVRFFFYSDDLGDCNYLPAIQPHLLKKHWEAHPYLKDDAIFYHDNDFIFTDYFDFTPYLFDDTWYMSDVRSYIGADYIQSKGFHKTKRRDDGTKINILEGMVEVFGMCACTIRANQQNTGGAQRLIKNVTAEYWQEVEEDSINLYNWLLQEKDNYGEGETNNIQIWTASMWAELWNAWKRKIQTEIPLEFNFCWATDSIVKWDSVKFFHNAGVIDDKSGMFFKAAYRDKYPYKADPELDPGKCSKKYFDIIKEVGETSVLIS